VHDCFGFFFFLLVFLQFLHSGFLAASFGRQHQF
jgi:hypothetical protein